MQPTQKATRLISRLGEHQNASDDNCMNEYVIPTWFFEEHGSRDITGSGPDVEIISAEIDAIEDGIDKGWSETQVQGYLKPRPYLFDGLYRHGHGIYAFSELSFAGKYYADWVIGNGSSGGIDWELIELFLDVLSLRCVQ